MKCRDASPRSALDHTDLRAERPELIWVSVTSHGRTSARSTEPWTDLTMSAASGIAWLNGYDDHTLPPMRGRGSQTVQITGTFAAMATLTALVHRDAGGPGQHVDVSAFAACNVTTESGTFFYLVAGETVQRQTGRHAMSQPTPGGAGARRRRPTRDHGVPARRARPTSR